MKAAKIFILSFLLLGVISCGSKDTKSLTQPTETKEVLQAYIPLDKGFSEYISGYTSGIIPANATIEIRFTPE